MGKVKDQLWDELEAEKIYSDFMDTTLTDDDYIYDMNDDWILSPTEDMNGQGVRWGIDTDKEKMSKDLGADVLQKVNKTVEEMGGTFYERKSSHIHTGNFL